MEMKKSERAVQRMTAGSNAGIIDRNTAPVYDTVTLAAGVSEYSPFSEKLGGNRSYDVTNLVEGGSVPAKQRWLVHGLDLTVLVPESMTAAQVAILNKALFAGSLRFRQDERPIFETTLSDILGAGVLVAQSGGVSSLTDGACYRAKMKFLHKLKLAAQTTFRFDLQFVGVAIPAELAGVKIRFTLDRTLDRLV